MHDGRPKHVKKEIWQQHLEWMKVMDEERARNKTRHKPRKGYNQQPSGQGETKR